MRSKNIIEALNDIDPAFIKESMPGRRKKQRKRAVLAGTIALLAAVGGVILIAVAAQKAPEQTPTEDLTPVSSLPTDKASSGDPTAQTATEPAEETPPESTSAWASWLAERGADDEEYGGKKMIESTLYHATYTDPDSAAHNLAPWEIYGEPARFCFVIAFDSAEFDLSFDSESGASPFTWHIWYKDVDADEAYKDCVVKPLSSNELENGFRLFRLPTYDAGMTDVHANGEDANDYRFVICVYRDDTGELICWHTCIVNVTPEYEKLLSEATESRGDL